MINNGNLIGRVTHVDEKLNLYKIERCSGTKNEQDIFSSFKGCVIKTIKYPLKENDVAIFTKKKVLCENNSEIFKIENYDSKITFGEPYFTVSFENESELKDFLKRNYSTEDNQSINFLYNYFFGKNKSPLKLINTTFSLLIKNNSKIFSEFLFGREKNFDKKDVFEIFSEHKKSTKNENLSFVKLITSFYRNICNEIYLRSFYLLGLTDKDIKEYLRIFCDLFFHKKKILNCEKKEIINESLWDISSLNAENFIENIFSCIKKNPYLFIFSQENSFLCDKIAYSFSNCESVEETQQKIDELKKYSTIFRKAFFSSDFYVTCGEFNEESFCEEKLKKTYGMIMCKEKETRKFYLLYRYTLEKKFISFIKEKIRENIKLKGSINKLNVDNIQDFLNRKIIIVTGGPGTGKTTLIEKIEEELHFKASKSILFLSFTGKAVSKIREKVKNKNMCNTINYALELFCEKENNNKKKHFDVIVIDETSMVSAALMNNFLNNFSFDLLILIGDKDQIPPIEWGNVFKLFIKTIKEEIKEHKICSSSSFILKLKKNYRQNENLKKIVNSFLKKNEFILEDKYIYNYRNLDELKNMLKFAFDGNTDKVTFISPLNVTCDFVNNIFSKNFSKGEKVMLTENIYYNKILIPNGIIGEMYNNDKNTIIIKNFLKEGNDIKLKRSEHPFSLCYCLTVDKMQGSDCEILVLIIPYKSIGLLSKERFYTAISRPKTNLFIFSDILNFKSILQKHFSVQ